MCCRSIRGVALALRLAIFVVVTPIPGITVVLADENVQLSPHTYCVEVSAAIVNESRRRASSRSDCDPQVAEDRARTQSYKNARDAIKQVCYDEISEAEKEDVCQSAGGSLPTTTNTSIKGAVPRAGASRVDDTAHLQEKLCVTLRDLPNETETSTRPAGIENGFCVLNNNLVTTKKVRSRARCGVQCRSINPQ